MKSEHSKYVKDFHFDTLEDLLKEISINGKLYHLLGTRYVFRGHSTEDYKLIPSILRENQLGNIFPSLEFSKENYLSMEFSSIETSAEFMFLLFKKAEEAKEQHKYVRQELERTDSVKTHVWEWTDGLLTYKPEKGGVPCSTSRFNKYPFRKKR